MVRVGDGDFEEESEAIGACHVVSRRPRARCKEGGTVALDMEEEES